MADAEMSAAWAHWPSPSIAITKDTWVGALDAGHCFPPPTLIDEKDCSVHHEMPKILRKPMGDLVDAFLYLAPRDLALKEQFPAYVALDAEYMSEVQRRESLPNGGRRQSLKEFSRQFVEDAENPLMSEPKPPDPKEVQANVESCRDRHRHPSAPQ